MNSIRDLLGVCCTCSTNLILLYRPLSSATCNSIPHSHATHHNSQPSPTPKPCSTHIQSFADDGLTLAELRARLPAAGLASELVLTGDVRWVAPRREQCFAVRIFAENKNMFYFVRYFTLFLCVETMVCNMCCVDQLFHPSILSFPFSNRFVACMSCNRPIGRWLMFDICFC